MDVSSQSMLLIYQHDGGSLTFTGTDITNLVCDGSLTGCSIILYCRYRKLSTFQLREILVLCPGNIEVGCSLTSLTRIFKVDDLLAVCRFICQHLVSTIYDIHRVSTIRNFLDDVFYRNPWVVGRSTIVCKFC